MIRVNLLPNASDRRGGGEGSQSWIALVLLAVVLEIIALSLFHGTKENELSKLKAEVARYDSQINDIKALVKDQDQVKSRLSELRAREDAIAKLQSGRSGPTEVLVELSRLLTPGKGPTLAPQKEAADAGNQTEAEQQVSMNYNANWDARRIWLSKYGEAERAVRLEGLARDGGDVFELSQRLKLSRYFEAVELLPGKQRDAEETKLDMVKFALQVKVKY
jgi:type IV pilus assembly protein PilN